MLADLSREREGGKEKGRGREDKWHPSTLAEFHIHPQFDSSQANTWRMIASLGGSWCSANLQPPALKKLCKTIQTLDFNITITSGIEWGDVYASMKAVNFKSIKISLTDVKFYKHWQGADFNTLKS